MREGGPVRGTGGVRMTVGFADQVAAFLANPANQSPFPGTIGLPAFAITSFGRRYGQGGFQVSGITFGTPGDFRLQELVIDQERISGFREKRSEQPQRFSYELRVGRQETGWVDATFTVPAQLAVQAVPGSIQLGPGGDLVPAGRSEPAPFTHKLAFQIPVLTDALTLGFDAAVYVFATADPSPVADLRRILALRRLLEADPHFLVSLDGTADQRPYLFVQLYPGASLSGPPLSEAAVVQTFGMADVLAAFITVPAM
jgi:hypothetical protein